VGSCTVTSLVQPGCPRLTRGTDPPATQDQGTSCCQLDHRDIECGHRREFTAAAACATTRLAASSSAVSPTTPAARGASGSSTLPQESGYSFAATWQASARRHALPSRLSNPLTTSGWSTSCSPKLSDRRADDSADRARIRLRIAGSARRPSRRSKNRNALDRVVWFGRCCSMRLVPG
jgi:hypothetical protein